MPATSDTKTRGLRGLPGAHRLPAKLGVLAQEHAHKALYFQPSSPSPAPPPYNNYNIAMGAAASKDPSAIVAAAKAPVAYAPPLGAPNAVGVLKRSRL